MTLFNRNKSPTVAPAQRTTTTTTAQRSSRFGRKTSPPARAPAPVAAPATNRHSMFGRRSSPPAVSPVTTSPSTLSSKTGSIFRRDKEDPSIATARQRVANAEAAEREADAALLKARESVRQAREEVKRLEAEAAEEARLAKIKQEQAREIGKRAMPLGRHG